VSRVRIVPLAIALVTIAASCGGKGGTAPAPEPARASPPQSVAAGATPEAAPLATTTVTLYFPSADRDGLAAETREIVDTARPADRGTQIVAALLDGPKTQGSLPAVPTGTTLRQLWVRDDGNAYADFSEELAKGMDGGSADEILTVYAIVDSLTSNVPAIRRVGILIAGRERDTLGHLDLSRPLPADLSLTAKAAP
jgi:spore germination protein GerM